ncbi:MAG: class I SAM-dependent methyltransferase [Proteobacteria bacterium]|nr:class I SAM-dependent methyltransferase [Pseudomonadota bacterium]
MTVDKGVFDDTAQTYEEGRRRLIPCFDDFYGMVMKLLAFPPHAHIRVLDLGAGTGILSAMIAEAFPNARITLVDISSEMLALARQKLGDDRRIRYLQANIALLALPGEFDAVVSALAIHHLKDDEKHALYGDIHKALAPGGIFINAEQVLGPTAVLEKHYDDIWLDEVHALEATGDELAEARRSMAEDRPATLEVQLAWLREVGFRQVDCWYKSGRFAVFSGVSS